MPAISLPLVADQIKNPRRDAPRVVNVSGGLGSERLTAPVK